ncbi:hypothetical protein [Alkaliphilus hydrothermalis]|uniref:Uncharacterized protein n=1 Tax=Alkaliphilus hydrothermalis TaxID=1482730 RepID=A0ABS2NNJ3_9FIRM|nr:hypothetical protein [Alkaliphilus hydrothermalis]MBM7614508.1 hypothetical protein [Alkaliphilus hydrothermalis]
MKDKIKKFKQHWGVMVALIFLIGVLSYSLRVSSYGKYEYVLDDINQLLQLSVVDLSMEDSIVEGIDGVVPTKIYVKSKESLKLSYSISEDIIKRYQNEPIDYNGPVTEIYFGDYVIIYQGIVTLKKIDEHGNLVTIKSASPAGEEISGKIRELEKMIRKEE